MDGLLVLGTHPFPVALSIFTILGSRAAVDRRPEQMEQPNQQDEQAIREETPNTANPTFPSVDDLIPTENKGIDLTPFEGKRVRIAKAEVTEVPSKYSPTGREKVLRVESDPVTTITDGEGNEKPICASELFSLTMEDGKLGWSIDPRAKLQNFLNKMKVGKPSELVGKETVVRLRTKKNEFGETTFLGFVV